MVWAFYRRDIGYRAVERELQNNPYHYDELISFK